MSKKDESKKDLKFQDVEEQDQKSSLPEFPKKDVKVGESSQNGGTDEFEELADVDLEEVAKDLVGIPFEVWGILNKGVKPLTETEKKLIAKPMSRVMVKYDVQKYCKDEFLMLGFLGFAVMKRIKESKKDDSNSNREKGSG